jgi:parallel beta-helix repeat protein
MKGGIVYKRITVKIAIFLLLANLFSSVIASNNYKMTIDLSNDLDNDSIVVFVDDVFNEGTPGWNVTHFNKIQNAIDALKSHNLSNSMSSSAKIRVYNGTYNENIIITSLNAYNYIDIIGNNSKNDTITLIDEENKTYNISIDNNTRLNGNIGFYTDFVNISYFNFTGNSIFNISSNNINISYSTLTNAKPIDIAKRNNVYFYKNNYKSLKSYNFFIEKCNNIYIVDNNLSDTGNSETIIIIRFSNSVSIIKNNISSVDTVAIGIELFLSNNVFISDNCFFNKYGEIIYAENIKNCTFYNNKYEWYEGVNIENNILTLIHLNASNYNFIDKNILIFQPGGNNNVPTENFTINNYILLKNSNDNYITNNSIIGNVKRNDNVFPMVSYIISTTLNSIKYLFDRDPEKTDDPPSAEGYGIRLVSSNGNMILNNKVDGVKVGISITQSLGNILSHNFIDNCSQVGLQLAATTYNLFVYNNLKANQIPVRADNAYRDYIVMNNFLEVEAGVVFLAPLQKGSTINGRFNYFDSKLGPILRIWGLPYWFFIPFCFTKYEDSSLGYFGSYLLENKSIWDNESPIYGRIT